MKLLGKIEQAQDAVSKEYVDGLVEPGGSGVSQEDFNALYEGVIEAEKVTAAGLKSLNDKLGELGARTVKEFASKQDFSSEINALANVIIENEKVTAAGLKSLNDKLGELGARTVKEFASKQDLSSEIGALVNVIIENEKVTAAGLKSLKHEIEKIYQYIGI